MASKSEKPEAMKAAPLFDLDSKAQVVTGQELADGAQPREPEFWLLCTEDECRELMAGTVPERVRDMARMVDWSLETGQMSFTGVAEKRQRKGKKTA